MKITASILFITVFITSMINAQNTLIKTMGGIDDDVVTSAVETTAGNLIVVGHTNSFGNGSVTLLR